MNETAARAALAVRSQDRCEIGGPWCEGRGTNAHHRLNRSQGGTWRLSNLVRACGSGTTGCHGLIGADPAWAYADGLLIPAGQDPPTVPVRLRHPVMLAWWFWLDDDGGLNFAEPYDAPTATMTGLTAGAP